MKISTISYLNSLPFIYGLQNSPIFSKIQLQLEVPRQSVQRLLSHEVDIALIPVAAIQLNPELKIISDFCIGATQKVDTVLLMSQCPIEEIKEIYLDWESMTSVRLIKVLMKHFWKQNPEFKNIRDYKDYQETLPESVVLIGDKTFNTRKQYKYIYDLAETWQHFTQLPFVFACWATNQDLPQPFVQEFNEALRYGITHVDCIVQNYDEKLISKQELANYYHQAISYTFDADKQKGMQLFFELNSPLI